MTEFWGSRFLGFVEKFPDAQEGFPFKVQVSYLREEEIGQVRLERQHAAEGGIGDFR